MGARSDILDRNMTSSLLPRALPQASRTRFAPAPTGWLHLGHVLNALYVWEAARAAGAGVLLRIEDHDRERCQPAYEAGILEDLDWLGFVPDVHPVAAFRAGTCDGRQSDREAVYRDAVRRLAAQGRVYACACSRRELAASGDRAGGERPYPGTCRTRGLPLADGYGWRVRLDDTAETFEDVLAGPRIPAAGRAVRRPPDPRPSGQLDLPVRRDRR
jgi:glutamyl/glutaminyl-tRNA synthetase